MSKKKVGEMSVEEFAENARKAKNDSAKNKWWWDHFNRIYKDIAQNKGGGVFYIVCVTLCSFVASASEEQKKKMFGGSKNKYTEIKDWLQNEFGVDFAKTTAQGSAFKRDNVKGRAETVFGNSFDLDDFIYKLTESLFKKTENKALDKVLINDVVNWVEMFFEKELDQNKREDFKMIYSQITKKLFDCEKGEEEGINMDNIEENIKNLIANGARQLILTGAPGTGKTYFAMKIAVDATKNELKNTQESSDAVVSGGRLFWKTEEKKDAPADELKDAPADELKDASADELKDAPAYEFVQFHPSYDYTDFVEGIRPIETEIDGKIEFCKIDGIFKSFCRYVAEYNYVKCGDYSGSLSTQDKYFYFIIDEINRADLSKVFGELMFCLERDKRGKKVQTQYQNLETHYTKQERTQFNYFIKTLPEYVDEREKNRIVDLLYIENSNYEDLKKDIVEQEKYKRNDVFSKGFFIPHNIIIIGTMNDIDRSVESMDFALRRRFVWYEVEVNKDSIKNGLRHIFKQSKANEFLECVDGDIIEEIADRINKLNDEVIKEELGKQYYISQGQFANLPKNIISKLNYSKPQQAGINNSESANEEKDKKGKIEKAVTNFLIEVYNLRLKSLLFEYVRGENNADKFLVECEKKLEIYNELQRTSSTPSNQNGNKQP